MGKMLCPVAVRQLVSLATLMFPGFITKMPSGKDGACVWTQKEPPLIKRNLATVTGETDTEPSTVLHSRASSRELSGG